MHATAISRWRKYTAGTSHETRTSDIALFLGVDLVKRGHSA
jgi:hypothetical protein